MHLLLMEGELTPNHNFHTIYSVNAFIARSVAQKPQVRAARGTKDVWTTPN